MKILVMQDSQVQNISRLLATSEDNMSLLSEELSNSVYDPEKHVRLIGESNENICYVKDLLSKTITLDDANMEIVGTVGRLKL